MNLENLTTIEKRVLAESGDTDAPTLQRLTQDGNSCVKRAALKSLRRIYFGQKLPDDWRQLSEQDCIDKLNSQRTDCKVLEVLVYSHSWRIRQAVACHGNTPDSIIELLANDEDFDVRKAVLDRHLPQEWRNLDDDERIERLKEGPVPVDVLELLAISAEWRVRQAVALHEGTPDAVLNQLAKDDDSDVKQAIEDRRLPVEWRHLDEDERIEKLAEPTVPPEVLEVLSHSGSWTVRQAVARNRSVDEAILNQLKDDNDSDVAAAARDGLLNRKLPEQWRLLDDDERIERLKEGPVPVDVLELLAISAEWRVRQAVARHEGTPDAVLNQLAKDDDSDVKQAIEDRRLPVEWRYLDEYQRSTKLSKDSATLEVLDVLSGSSKWRVRQAVANNAKASDKILKELARDSDFDVASAAREALLLRRLPIEWQALDTSQKINRVMNGKTTDEVLEALALSATQEIREAVASSLETPIELLRTLSKDEDDDVKIIAKETMIRRLLPKEWMDSR